MSPTRAAHSAKEPSSDPLRQRLSLYSLAAAAAGVSLMALAIPAEGEVVITRKTIPIPASPFGVGVGVSLSNNGIDDFTFRLFRFYSATSTYPALSLGVKNAPDGRGIVGFIQRSQSGGAGRYASALMRGAKIGPSASFRSLYPGEENHIEVSYLNPRRGGRQLEGKWGGNPTNRYVGVRFSIDGETHYGWVRLSVNTEIPLHMSATITAYAYETVPNKRILAGTAEGPTVKSQSDDDLQSPGGPSLGMLALGVNGLPLWQRNENMF